MMITANTCLWNTINGKKTCRQGGEIRRGGGLQVVIPRGLALFRQTPWHTMVYTLPPTIQRTNIRSYSQFTNQPQSIHMDGQVLLHNPPVSGTAKVVGTTIIKDAINVVGFCVEKHEWEPFRHESTTHPCNIQK